jgi:hypothetical protein
MELQEFVSKAISDIVNATKTANEQSERDVKLASLDSNRTIEFDVAVSVEEKVEGGAKGGIKVWGLLEASGGKSKEAVNSTVSRLRFGVNVDPKTRAEHQAEQANWDRHAEEVRRINERNSAI